MKYINQLSKEGKLTTRPAEDRGKGERALIKDTSLHQADVCLHCRKKECTSGSDRCYAREAGKHGGTV